MKDTCEREINYLRISITDRCNLRCRYCMPHGISWLPMEEILTYEELIRVCTQAALLGIDRIKITGGEPLVRKGCQQLIQNIKKIPGIRQVTLTTNGVLLKEMAEPLYQAGVDGVNVSLDTLDQKRFKEITGFDFLEQVRHGIDAMYRYPVPLKINTVPLPETGEADWISIAALAKERKLQVRFIEMMPIGQGQQYRSVPNTEIFSLLEKTYGTAIADSHIYGNGPAIYYHFPGFKGSIGFISAIHQKFCDQCNRIRLTSIGQIKPCLCFGEEFDLKPALRTGNDHAVRMQLQKAILEKPPCHTFEHRDQITEKREMTKIGG